MRLSILLAVFVCYSCGKEELYTEEIPSIEVTFVQPRSSTPVTTTPVPAQQIEPQGDPLFSVNVSNARDSIIAYKGYTGKIGEDLYFKAIMPRHTEFKGWEVQHQYIGRSYGPLNNPIGVGALTTQSSGTLIEIEPKYKLYPEACVDGCRTELWIDPLTQPNTYQDNNGYHHIEPNGNYFTIKNLTSKLDPEYTINDVQLIKTHWDSDYWMILENLQLSVSYYRPFGLWTQGFSQPLAYLNTTITLSDALGLFGMTNIVGYAIDKNTCFSCPYSSTLFGRTTKVNKNRQTQKSILLNPEMAGDTLTVFTKTTFGDYWTTGMWDRTEVVQDSLRIIVDYLQD